MEEKPIKETDAGPRSISSLLSGSNAHPQPETTSPASTQPRPAERRSPAENNVQKPDYKAGCADDVRESFRELANLARHYSALRFVMFSVFVTITAGLLAVEFDATKRPAPGVPVTLFRVAAFALVLGFISMLQRVGNLVNFYQRQTYEFEADSGRKGLGVVEPTDLTRWKKRAKHLTILPFVLVEIGWIVLVLLSLLPLLLRLLR